MSASDTYWLWLLEGAHMEARRRSERGIRPHPPQTARLQTIIDRARRERGLLPLYERDEEVA